MVFSIKGLPLGPQPQTPAKERLLPYSEFNQWSARTEPGSSGPDPLLLEMVYEYKDVLRGV